MPQKLRTTRMPPRQAASGSSSAGPAVDAQGGPVIDPTENVIALTDAANKRQDDLRDAEDRLVTERIARIEAMAGLRAEHSRELRHLEAGRLDAIRQVDQLALSTAHAASLAAIQTLAATTTANAETLRSLVSSTAVNIAAQTDRIVGNINERIAILEKSSYTGQGRANVADPMLEAMLAKLNTLMESRASTAGTAQGGANVWAIVAAVIGFGLVIVGLILQGRG